MQGSEQDLFDRYLQADTLALAEAGVRALADLVLPQSAKQQVEKFFCQFRDRGGKIAEDGAMTGCADFFFWRVCCCVLPYCCSRLHELDSLQNQAWFPAYMECLLDPDWPIPGLSEWHSKRAKEFLHVSFSTFLLV